MKYSNLYKKWKTEKTEYVQINLINVKTDGPVKQLMNIHEAPMGEFLKDYIKHLTMSKVRKKAMFDWKITEECMRKILNQVILTFHR